MIPTFGIYSAIQLVSGLAEDVKKIYLLKFVYVVRTINFAKYL